MRSVAAALQRAAGADVAPPTVWLALGGDDLALGDASFADIERCTAAVLDALFEARAGVRVVQFGNELLCPFCFFQDGWKRRRAAAACGSIGNATCFNTLLGGLQRGLRERVAPAAHANYTLLDLRGTLQYTSGVPRAGVGRPNLDEWTPAEYYTPDCLHPSEAGFRHLFRELARTLEAG